jgi:hypothetical protein
MVKDIFVRRKIMSRVNRVKDRSLFLIFCFAISVWAGSSEAQNVDCAIITKIEGNQITLNPEDGKNAGFVIESKDILGLKVGDRVKVQDGHIVMCVFPPPVPDSGKKPPAFPGAKPEAK